MTTKIGRAHGIDISHWQGRFKMPADPPYPIDFVVQKVTEGIFRDPAYAILKDDTLSVPVRGAYHYFRAQWDWKAQMDTFLSNVDGYQFVALDAEKTMNFFGDPKLNKPYPGFANTVLLSLKYLQKNFPGKVLMYGGAGMCDWMYPLLDEVKVFDLWAAHYWFKPDPMGKANYFTINQGAAKLRHDWKFWQYTDKGWDDKGKINQGKKYGVLSHGLDLDVYNGTVEEMTEWLNVPVKRCAACGQVIP